MICPVCGTENKPKFKFCVKCGSNMENPSEVNIEQVDMGGYRSEEDYASEKNNFKIGSGTFTISDRAPSVSTGMFTAEELNSSDEEFDFSSFDEPYIPKLDADRLTVPSGKPEMHRNQSQQNQQSNNNLNAVPNGYPQQFSMPQNAVAGQISSQQMNMNSTMNIPQGTITGQQMNGMTANPYMNQMYGGQPVYGVQPMMAPPQIVGYDQNGIPIYSQPQPVMYAPPQIVGYDQNGMPIYSQPQPVMYAPPQIVGYDQNGMPIYSQPQPVMYAQPMMGEGAVQPYPAAQGAGQITNVSNVPNMQGMPNMPAMQGMPVMHGMTAGQPVGNNAGTASVQPQSAPQQDNNSGEKVKVSNEFWNSFFSGNGNVSQDNGNAAQDDFFSKSRHDHSKDMGSVSADGLDVSRLKNHERKKNTYMNETPEVNADELQPNKADELNKRYMRGTAVVNADELEAKRTEKKRDIMGVTSNVNADELQTFERKKSHVTMNAAGEANADELEVYEHEHKEAIMEQPEHAVEALPKKKNQPEDEIDAIELPEYMQAKKTVKKEAFEIPGLPE